MGNKITKDQIKTILQYFSDYCKWMYFDKEARESLETRVVQSDGEKFVITIRKDGYYGVRMPQRKLELIVEAGYITAPPASNESIENYSFKYRILNEDIIPKDIYNIVNEAIYAFVSSMFTRTIAFCLFARLQDVSIDQISEDLAIGINNTKNEII